MLVIEYSKREEHKYYFSQKYEKTHYFKWVFFLKLLFTTVTDFSIKKKKLYYIGKSDNDGKISGFALDRMRRRFSPFRQAFSRSSKGRSRDFMRK